MQQAIFVLLVLTAVSPPMLADCRKAERLVLLAFDVANQDHPSRQEGLFHSALRECPQHPAALNNLGVIQENRGHFDQAIHYYQRALKARPGFLYAWYGLGDTYQKQGRLVLALEAYLHVCQKDEQAKEKAQKLLIEGQYNVVQKGQTLDRASLLALYDPARRKAISQKAASCGIQAKATIEPVVVFRNFHFALGSAKLAATDLPQLTNIAAALTQLKVRQVLVKGHTDSQPFRNQTQSQSDDLNRRLSYDRATEIKDALRQHGIAPDRIAIQGQGPDSPLDEAHNPAAYAKNRRVEIYAETE